MSAPKQKEGLKLLRKIFGHSCVKYVDSQHEPDQYQITLKMPDDELIGDSDYGPASHMMFDFADKIGLGRDDVNPCEGAASGAVSQTGERYADYYTVTLCIPRDKLD